MASSKTTIEWKSKDAAIIRTLDKVEQGFDNLNRKMDRVERTSKRTAKSSKGMFAGVAKDLKKVALGVIGGGGVLAAFQMWSEANQRVLKEAQEIGKKYDEIVRKFQIQAGLGDLQSEESEKRLVDLAVSSRVDISQAGQVATRLAAGGVSARAATGKAGAAIFDAIAATDLAGEPINAEEFTSAVIAYLKSQGNQAPTAKDIEQISLRMANLVLKGEVEGSEFSQLASIGADVGQYLSQEEQFAAFGALRGTLGDASKTAQSLRRFVSITSSAGGLPDTPEEKEALRQREKALQALGLKPEQVDLVGEDLLQTLDVYAKAIDKVPEHQRAGILQSLFGMRGVSSFQALIATRPTIERFLRVQDDPKEFGDAVARAGRGRAAIGQALKTEVEAMKAQKDTGADIVLQALKAEMLERGVSPYMQTLIATRYNIAQGVLGDSPLAGLNFTPFAPLTGERPGKIDILERIVRASRGDTGSDILNARAASAARYWGLDEESGAMRQLIESLERNTDAQEGNGPRVRNPPAAAQNAGRVR